MVEQSPESRVRAALARILATQAFERAPRMCALLTWVVERALEGDTEALGGYRIGVAVYERPDDFDPRTDTLVRVEMARLRRLLDRYHADTGSPDVRIDVPKGGYLPKFTFDAQPSKVDPPALLPGFPLIRVSRFEHSTGIEPHIAASLAQELRHYLGRFSELMVVDPAGEEAADAHYELAGHVGRSLAGLRISVALLDCVEQRTIWHADHTCPQESNRVVDGIVEIAMTLAAQITRTYGPIERRAVRRANLRPPSSWDAWALRSEWRDYRARGVGGERNRILLARVEELLRSAPDDADLVAIRCSLYQDAWTFDVTDPEVEPDWYAQLSNVERAAALDPESLIVQQVQALAQWMTGDRQGAIARLETALRTNPCANEVRFQHALLVGSDGDWERARAVHRQACGLGFAPPAVRIFELRERLCADDPDAVIETTRSVLFDAPLVTAFWLAVAHGTRGDRAAADPVVRELRNVAPGFERWMVARYRRWLGGPDLVRRCLAGLLGAGLELRDESGRPVRPADVDRVAVTGRVRD